MKIFCLILLLGIFTNSFSQLTDHSSTIIVGDNGVKEYETPEIVHLGMVNPDLLLLKIRARYVEHGRLTPYLLEKDDTIRISGQHRFIIRNGEAIGSLAGRTLDILYTLDIMRGKSLAVEEAVDPSNYYILSDNERINVKTISRKTKPVDGTRSPAKSESPLEHTLTLTLEKPLQKGVTYSLICIDGLFEKNAYHFTNTPGLLRSEAIHVTQVGFHPNDPVKKGFLSFWTGDGGGVTYSENLPFNLVDCNSGLIVFQGATELFKRNSNPDNVSKTDIHSLDFSSFSRPGKYKIVVEGIGSSYDFEIDESCWADAFGISMKGLYCQRNGIELGPPITTFLRPRGFQPEDGVKVFVSSRDGDLPDDFLPRNALTDELPLLDYTPIRWFADLVKNMKPVTLPYAWGGYMDAGDWDRRGDHALMPLMMFDLWETNPERFSELTFDIPESNDSLPDLINEALWKVDFLVRMQQSDGSVFSAIESGAHPRRGETSWLESLPVMAFGRGIVSAYNLSSVGAHAALWFKNANNGEMSDHYYQSALRAFNWAESQLQEEAGESITASRCLAAASLFRLTGEETYNNIFVSTTRFIDKAVPFYYSAFGPSGDEQGQAGWVYLRTDHPIKNHEINNNIEAALIRDANAMVQSCFENDFHWVRPAGREIRWGALSMPESHVICRAHFISGNDNYLKAIVMSTFSGAGANPLNTTYVTGIGHRWPQHPLHEDALVSNQPLFAGVTLGGPLDPLSKNKKNASRYEPYQYPDFSEWPVTEHFLDVVSYIPMNEFTVHQTMLPTSFVWGYLAGVTR
jgi:endoglucanase